MGKLKAPDVPFVEAHMIGSKQKPTAIAIDLSMTTSDKGAALGIATRLHQRNAPPDSYHYIVDEASIYRGVWDTVAAYRSPYRAIDVLVCAEPREQVGMWEDDKSRAVLSRTASLVADLILAYKIRPRYLDGEDLYRWSERRTRRRGGLIVRVPGAWPHEDFLESVTYSKLRREGA